MNSIKLHGLLHPIVITDKNDLICGKRRIEACRKLCLVEIEANIVSLEAFSFSEAEADENIVRKPFTVEEIAQIDQFYRDKEEAAAMIRQKQGNLSENFAKGRSSAKIAERVGVSDRTLEKIRIIREASLQNPTIYGELWDRVGEGKMKIDKGYNTIKKIEKIRAAESSDKR